MTDRSNLEMTDEPNPERLPEILDPGSLEEHGITIPVPTPTGIAMPNPWGPPSGDGESMQGAESPRPEKSDQVPADR